MGILLWLETAGTEVTDPVSEAEPQPESASDPFELIPSLTFLLCSLFSDLDSPEKEKTTV